MSSPKRRKLSLVDDGLPAGCTVTFAAGFVSNDQRYRLLEATPEILSALAAGERLHFKGDIRCLFFSLNDTPNAESHSFCYPHPITFV